MKDTVLVVEDETDVANLLRYHLTHAGFHVIVSAEGDKGLALARENRPDVIVLDLMLPGLTGYEVCRALKKDPNTASVAIIMLTAKCEPHERIKGFELGADDYMTKPFSPRELVLRIHALMRRLRTASHTEIVTVNGLSLNKSALEIRIDGQRIDLPMTEFKLLSLLLEHQGQILSREKLLEEVWCHDPSIDSRTVDAYMRRLREKLGSYSSRLETIRRVGYRLNAQQQDAGAAIAASSGAS